MHHRCTLLERSKNRRMDSVFRLSNGDRVSCLLNLMQSFGCSYVCLWTYSTDINLLYCEEGHFQEDTTTVQVLASSSSGTTLARKLFEEYKRSLFVVGNQSSVVPGLAFKNKNPYLELQELDLQRLSSSEKQRNFYSEARIKMAVFLGCDRGEIELGMPYIPQNLEMRMQNIFSQDATTRHQTSQASMEVSRSIEQNRPSPSSSQSLDSPEYSQLFYTLPTNTITPTTMGQSTTEAETIPLMPILNLLLNETPFPTPESTDTALTRAYLAILSSTSTSNAQQTSVSPYENQVSHRRASAFKSYHQSLGISSQMRSNLRRQTSMFKRVIGYYRGVNYRRIQEHTSIHGSRPTNTQLHHMISERRRREKINDSFQALRSLLPQGTKKDKASVLRTAKEYLSSLNTQLSDLAKRNQILEAELETKKVTTTTNQVDVSTSERLSVQITSVPGTLSRERLIDLHVSLRGGSSMENLVMKLLDLLKQTRDASLVSIEAQTYQQELMSVVFRLRIEFDLNKDWEEEDDNDALEELNVVENDVMHIDNEVFPDIDNDDEPDIIENGFEHQAIRLINGDVNLENIDPPTQDWVMHEYTLEEDELKRCQNVHDHYAIYKMFKKSGAGPKNGEQYGAPFREEDWADDDFFRNSSNSNLVSIDQHANGVSLAEICGDAQVDASKTGSDELLNGTVDDHAPWPINLDDFEQSLSQLQGAEDTVNTWAGEAIYNEPCMTTHTLGPQQHNLNSNFRLGQSGDATEVTSDVNSDFMPEVTSTVCLEFADRDLSVDDFLEMDDLLSPEPAQVPSIQAQPAENRQLGDYDDGFDLYYDADLFLGDFVPINQAVPPTQYPVSQEDGSFSQVGLYPNNVATFGNETWNYANSHLHNPSEASQRTMPLQPPGAVYTGVSETVSIGSNQNQNEKPIQQTQQWLSSTLWSFVESIPAAPASAAESVLVNKALMRMSSFSRMRIGSRSTVTSTGDSVKSASAGVRGRVKGFFLVSFLAALFAVLCVFIGSHSSVPGKLHCQRNL